MAFYSTIGKILWDKGWIFRHGPGKSNPPGGGLRFVFLSEAALCPHESVAGQGALDLISPRDSGRRRTATSVISYLSWVCSILGQASQISSEWRPPPAIRVVGLENRSTCKSLWFYAMERPRYSCREDSLKSAKAASSLYAGINLQPGDPVEVELPAPYSRVKGTIRSRDGYCFGVEFLNSLSPPARPASRNLALFQQRHRELSAGKRRGDQRLQKEVAALRRASLLAEEIKKL